MINTKASTRKIRKEATKKLRDNVTLIKELQMDTNFELDFDALNKKRKTVADVITASKLVTGDIVQEEDKFQISKKEDAE